MVCGPALPRMMSAMDGQTTVVAVRAVVLLLALGVAAAVAGRRLGLPDAVGFVLVGLVAASPPPRSRCDRFRRRSSRWRFPGLVLEAAYRLHAEDRRPALGPLRLLRGMLAPRTGSR